MNMNTKALEQQLRPPRYDPQRSTANGRWPTDFECRPRRPARNPRWQPGRKHPVKARRGWRPRDVANVELHAAPDLGQIRINFKYNNVFTTSADFSGKSGRQQYFEGPHEIRYSRWFEVAPRFTDIEHQTITLEITDVFGGTSQYTIDGMGELAGGQLFGFEEKPSKLFFAIQKPNGKPT